MKYLVVLLVVAVGLWMLLARSRGGRRDAPRQGQPPAPKAMVACAHCGLHLPESEASMQGDRAYCCDAHRALGPGVERR
jgi:uncharacterized protein